MVAAGRGDWRGDDAEVLARIVGAEVEQAVAMVWIVLLLVEARGDEAELRGGSAGGEEMELVGGVAAGLDHQVEAVAGAAYAEVEAFILFEKTSVLFDGGAPRMWRKMRSWRLVVSSSVE